MSLSNILEKHREEILRLDKMRLSHRQIVETLRKKHDVHVSAPTLHVWFKLNQVGRYHGKKSVW